MTILLLPRHHLTEGQVWPRGHHHPSTTVTLDGTTFMLACGTDDRWTLYETPWGVAVVTRNYQLHYVGVELLDPDWHEQEAAIVGCTGEGWIDTGEQVTRARNVRFFQDTHPGQIGPKDTFDYTDETILRRTLKDIE